LSRREREVAVFAAQGATNTQISAALYVSVRTVESHIYATFRKLGITRRDQLADALREE
jgi:DNA-binding NarL/FixJ family response regulator